jgi:amino acid transporter
VLELVAAVSFVACAIASTTALARLALALAVDGLLPERFARPHPRLRTPHRALLVVTPVLAAVPAAALGTLGVRAAMDLLIEVSVLGYLVAYLLVCAAAPVFLHRIGERTAASVAGGVLTTAVLVGAVVAHLVRPTPVRGWVGAATLLLIAASGLGWWAVTRWRPPDRAVQLGRYDEATVDDVWWGPAPALAGARRPGT